jgi:two-component system, chemotaxis family, CheB/CheR fusion protein
MTVYADKSGRAGRSSDMPVPTVGPIGKLPSALRSPLVVGIGASAGGVEALSRFFDTMPPDSGAAFVIVLHLDPTRESQMAHVLSSHTAMSVVQVVDDMQIAPNTMYVIAPDKDLTVRNGALQLVEPAESRGHRHPVDVLFRSLAADQGERAIAIVLSGTGSNGTDGLKEVKAAGGLILVQDPSTAKFDGMPRSAIAAGMADHILSPGAMPEIIVRYISQEYIAAPNSGETGTSTAQPVIDQILTVLFTRTGNDFRNYRRSTLQRRIQRRLGLKNVETLDSYLNELRSNAEEAPLLVKDLLINVTSFFRDAEAWKALANLVIAPLVTARETGASIRAWVTGCSTGEEAYTLAMLISEQAVNVGKKFDVKIFATDAREDNLKTARDGMYPLAAVTGLSSVRQRQFFDKLDASYQVKKDIRSMVVFAPQNLLRDPPFSHLDLVSCRNLLIYLEPEAQQSAIALFHFALEEGGSLLLGNTETLGRHETMFEIVSKKWRIFRRAGPARLDIVNFPVLRGTSRPIKTNEETTPQLTNGISMPAGDIARRALLEHFAPAAVLIDRNCHVVYFHGSTGNYLEQPTGEPSKDLFLMTRDGLTGKLRSAVRTAFAENRSVHLSANIKQNRTISPVAVVVAPVAPSANGSNYLLVSFAPGASHSSISRNNLAQSLAADTTLQDELIAVRGELQNTIEHLETTNEELKASNEEATSMNEELQSTNEELETSKEEMQSFNEELHTVNSQLQHKVHELEDSTNDLNNLLTGTETVTLFIDANLCIKWFTPSTRELFNLMLSDVGRPISHFARKFDDENLLADAEKVLQKLVVVEAEVLSSAGRWYLRRMLPYRTLDNRIAGVVITFIDVTERKQDRDASDEARIYAQAIVETIRQPLLVLDDTQHVVSVNTAFEILFKVSEAECQGELISELEDGEWDIPKLRLLLDEVLSKDQHFNDVEVEHEFRDVGHRCLLINGRKLTREGARTGLILLAIEDITERKRTDASLTRSELQYRTLFSSIDDGFCIIEKTETEPGQPIDFRYLEANPAFEKQTGTGGVVGKTIREAFPGEPESWFDMYDKILREGTSIRIEHELMTKNRVLELHAFRIEDSTQRRLSVIFRDITSRKHAEEISGKLTAIVDSSEDAIMSADLDNIVTSWNRGAARLFGYVASEILEQPIQVFLTAESQSESLRILESLQSGGSTEHLETVWRRKDGTDVWISLTVSPLRNAAGNLLGASIIARDVSIRRRAEEHREILVGELNHRVKNTLAIVSAIASQTLGGAVSLESAKESFASRLLVLSRAHDLLMHGNWSGTDLTSVVKATIEPHQGGQSRFRVEGPFVPLQPSLALTFSLAIHELCTNAAKYGALSVQDGFVDIVWQVQGDVENASLQLTWTESGGPTVSTPTRKGFGSRLIERALAVELTGEVHVVYNTSGVICTIDAPLPPGHLEVEPFDANWRN